VLDPRDLTIADDHVRSPRENRHHEPGDVRAVVLVVGIGVHDHIGPELQAGVQTRLESRRQTLVVRQAHDVVDPVCACHRDRLIGRSVVDDQPFHRIEALERARQVRERPGELIGLVEAGNLNDELHYLVAPSPPCGRAGAGERRRWLA